MVELMRVCSYWRTEVALSEAVKDADGRRMMI